MTAHHLGTPSQQQCLTDTHGRQTRRRQQWQQWQMQQQQDSSSEHTAHVCGGMMQSGSVPSRLQYIAIHAANAVQCSTLHWSTFKLSVASCLQPKALKAHETRSSSPSPPQAVLGFWLASPRVSKKGGLHMQKWKHSPLRTAPNRGPGGGAGGACGCS